MTAVWNLHDPRTKLKPAAARAGAASSACRQPRT